MCLTSCPPPLLRSILTSFHCLPKPGRPLDARFDGLATLLAAFFDMCVDPSLSSSLLSHAPCFEHASTGWCGMLQVLHTQPHPLHAFKIDECLRTTQHF